MSTPTFPAPAGPDPRASGGLRNWFTVPDRQPAGTEGLSAWLDRSDRIVHLPPTWDDLAPDGLKRLDVLGRPAAWFIEDPTVRECFRVLLDRVRREHRPARMIKSLACDPTAREMHVTLSPQSAGAIEISWVATDVGIFEDEHASVYRFPPEQFVRMCSWCRNIYLFDQWQRIDHVGPELGLLSNRRLPPITHGICPSCCAALWAEDATVGVGRLAV